jgi:outer membrane protein, heavy metal efflux system
MSRPLLIIPLIGLLLTGAGSAAATTLAEAVDAALTLAEQTPRVTAAQREADAIRTHAGSPVAQD